MTADEWREFLEENFPDGARLIIPNSTEKAALAGDARYDVIAWLDVHDMDEEGNPLVALVSAHTDRPYRMWVDRVEEREWGLVFFPEEPNKPPTMLSRELTDEQREAVANARA